MTGRERLVRFNSLGASTRVDHLGYGLEANVTAGRDLQRKRVYLDEVDWIGIHRRPAWALIVFFSFVGLVGLPFAFMLALGSGLLVAWSVVLGAFAIVVYSLARPGAVLTVASPRRTLKLRFGNAEKARALLSRLSREITEKQNELRSVFEASRARDLPRGIPPAQPGTWDGLPPAPT